MRDLPPLRKGGGGDFALTVPIILMTAFKPPRLCIMGIGEGYPVDISFVILT